MTVRRLPHGQSSTSVPKVRRCSVAQSMRGRCLEEADDDGALGVGGEGRRSWALAWWSLPGKDDGAVLLSRKTREKWAVPIRLDFSDSRRLVEAPRWDVDGRHYWLHYPADSTNVHRPRTTPPCCVSGSARSVRGRS